MGEADQHCEVNNSNSTISHTQILRRLRMTWVKRHAKSKNIRQSAFINLLSSSFFINHAAFHHKRYPFHGGDIVEWVARDGDDVGEQAFFQPATVFNAE